MIIEREIFDRIRKINWFSNCGNYSDTATEEFVVRTIHSWEEANYYCSQPIWEDATLRARNKLTMFLHEWHDRKYSEWNKLVEEANSFFDKEVLPKIVLIKEKNNLDHSFVDCVGWDVVHAIMEYAYKGCTRRPTFFLDLLSIYEEGNFPCGWECEDEDDDELLMGTLIVF